MYSTTGTLTRNPKLHDINERRLKSHGRVRKVMQLGPWFYVTIRVSLAEGLSHYLLFMV